MLRSAYRVNSSQDSRGFAIFSREGRRKNGAAHSSKNSFSDPAKAYDLAQFMGGESRLGLNSSHQEMAGIDMEKQTKLKERWDSVLSKKSKNVALKSQHLKDLLF